MPRRKNALPPGLAALGNIVPGQLDQRHLGNFGAVFAQLMELLERDRLHCVAAAAGMPWPEANAKTVADIKALAAAFLGQDPTFHTSPHCP